MAGFCGNCGKPITEGAGFCGNCGTKCNQERDQKETNKKMVTQTKKQHPLQKIHPFCLSNMGIFLLLAAFCWYGLYDLLSATAMMRNKGFLEIGRLEMYEAFSVFLMFLFFYLTFYCLLSEKKKPLIGAFRVLLACAPLFFLIVLNYRIWMWALLSPIEVFTLKEGIVPVLLGCVSFVFLPVGLYHAVVNSLLRERARGFLADLFQMMRHPLKWFLWTLMMVVLIVVPDIVLLPFSLISSKDPYNFADQMAMSLAMTFATAFLGIWFLRRIQKTTAKWMNQMATKKRGKMLIAGYFPITHVMVSAVSIVLLMAAILTMPREEHLEKEEGVRADLEELTSYSANMLFFGELENAYAYSRQALDRMDAYGYFVREDAYGLEQLTKTQPNDPVIRWLQYKLTKDISYMENYVIKENPFDSDMKQMLLYAYGEMKDRDMTDEREAYRDEILNMCIGEQIYGIELPPMLPEGEKGERVIEKLEEDYVHIRAGTEALNLLICARREGGISAGKASEMIALAERYPENAGLQYTAGALGAEAASDDAGFYFERGIECVKRYLDLAEKDRSVGKEDLVGIKISCAEQILTMRGYEQAAEILDTISEKEAGEMQDTIGMMKLLCYESMDDGNSCYRNAAELIDNGSEDPVLWYYCGVGALKDGDKHKALEALETLAKQVQDDDLEEEELYRADFCFYSLAEYIVLNDNATWTGYQYGIYRELDETERDQLSPYVRHYLDTMDLYFNGYYVYEDALAEAEKILSIQSNLPYARYLKGCILFSMGEYEESIENLEYALATDPENATFLYVLANAYDGAGMYETAFALSAKANEILPIQDHEDDWYGVSVHNANLLRKLQETVGGEEK